MRKALVFVVLAALASFISAPALAQSGQTPPGMTEVPSQSG